MGDHVLRFLRLFRLCTKCTKKLAKVWLFCEYTFPIKIAIIGDDKRPSTMQNFEEDMTMKWTRKTEFGAFKPYVSEDGKYIVADMSMSSGASYVPEFAELKRNFRDSEADRVRFLNYCREHKLNMNGANWVVVNNETGEAKFPFKSAKAAKEYAESI